MTYKEIIELLRQFAQDHAQINAWGYGNLSDIEDTRDPFTGEPVNNTYPYQFINPRPHTIQLNQVTYNFNIIQMELTSDKVPVGLGGPAVEWVAQSNAEAVLMDLMAWIKLQLPPGVDLVTTGVMTPFKERFADEVAGMTLELGIQVANRLSKCNIPGIS